MPTFQHTAQPRAMPAASAESPAGRPAPRGLCRLLAECRSKFELPPTPTVDGSALCT